MLLSGGIIGWCIPKLSPFSMVYEQVLACFVGLLISSALCASFMVLISWGFERNTNIEIVKYDIDSIVVVVGKDKEVDYKLIRNDSIIKIIDTQKKFVEFIETDTSVYTIMVINKKFGEENFLVYTPSTRYKIYGRENNVKFKF